jgi:hypothetical protein
VLPIAEDHRLQDQRCMTTWVARANAEPITPAA